ncbi:hypothetical protein B0H19DRAFT_686355 [Mycena capillaripes]|nr:hypothetical protein B0H19DRAFT_686355 [Mycena capillaripes]
MPHLEMLSVWDLVQGLDLFNSAPKLTMAEFGCRPECWPALVALPLHQLLFLSCFELVGHAGALGLDMLPSLSMIPHLAPLARFRLRLFNSEPEGTWHQGDPPSSITSDISVLCIDFDPGISHNSATLTFTTVVEGLTLPSLELLDIDLLGYPDIFIHWPQSEFLALATRSAFHTHLKVLHLWHVVIAEPQLLECLAALPLLERLAISDHQLTPDSSAEQLLVTDSLLTALTRKPDRDVPCPLPHLTSFGCQTLLKFSDTVLLDLILSRVPAIHADKTDVEFFEVEIWWLRGHHRELDPSVVARMEELKDFQYSFDPAEVET